MFWLDEITLKARKILEEYVKEFNDGEPLIPPIPIEYIIDFKYGIRIIPLEPRFQKEYSGYYDRSKKIIAVNKKENSRRQRFTSGHELCHHIQNHPNEAGLFRDRKGDIQENTSDYTRKNIEREADRFAAEIIMPSPMVITAFQNKINTKEVISENTWDDFIKTFKKGKLELITLETVPTISELATEFGVSKIAMRYKLINLRLIPDEYQGIIGLAEFD